MARRTFLHDLTQVTIRTRGYLPHWEQPGAAYSLTIRLDDSLPRAVVDRLREEYRARKRAITDGRRRLSAIERAELCAQIDLAVDTELHRGYGSSFMKDARVADLVATTLVHFEGERYHLAAWCVMPNHVHAVITPFDGWTLDRIIRSWKGYSARMANRILQRSGTFWQREYFDRIIRDERDLATCVAYVIENPMKAGLRNWRWTSAEWEGVGG